MQTIKKKIDEASSYIRNKCDINPQIGIILGTGLGDFGKSIDLKAEIDYKDIPYFPVSTVEFHAGKLLLGSLEGKNVFVMEGRFHLYEGYTPQEITLPIRVMKALGVKMLIVSSAVGGMNPLFFPGEIVIVDDHINLMGVNPLVGTNDDSLGPRFPDMSRPYDREIITLAEKIALEERIKVQRGVMVGVLGPNLETRAEYRFLKSIGADVVGMSMIPEILVGVHSGLRNLGLAVITDSCLPDALEPANIEKIVAVANKAQPNLTLLMRKVIAQVKL